MKMHRHFFKKFATSGWNRTLAVILRCECGETKKRKPTSEERRESREMERVTRETHVLERKFQRSMGTLKDESFRHFSGYEAMLRAEAFAKKHPERVFITGCDDSSFMCSNLVAVTHEAKRDDGSVNYMGTTVYYLPQNGIGASSFFLYPGHVEGLIEVLKKLRKRSRLDPKRLFAMRSYAQKRRKTK